MASSNVEYAHIPHLNPAVIPTLQNESFLSSPSNGTLEALTGLGAAHINGKPACDEFDQLIKNMAQVRTFLPVSYDRTCDILRV